MAPNKVNWVKIRNDYIHDKGSQRELAEKYGVTARQIAEKSVNEGWVKKRQEQRSKTSAKLQQKTEDLIVDSEVKKLEKMNTIMGNLLIALEKSSSGELDLHLTKRKKKTKVTTDDGTKEVEIITEEEHIKSEKGIIDVVKVKQISSAIKDIAETMIMIAKDSEDEYEDDGLLDALRNSNNVLVDDMKMIQKDGDGDGETESAVQVES